MPEHLCTDVTDRAATDLYEVEARLGFLQLFFESNELDLLGKVDAAGVASLLRSARDDVGRVACALERIEEIDAADD